jgi:hypothetical protein
MQENAARFVKENFGRICGSTNLLSNVETHIEF